MNSVAMSPYLFEVEDQIECLRDPTRWVMIKKSDGAAVYAYNSETGKSMNPAAPPMEAELWAALQDGQTLAIKNELESPFVAWTESQLAAKFARRVGLLPS